MTALPYIKFKVNGSFGMTKCLANPLCQPPSKLCIMHKPSYLSNISCILERDYNSDISCPCAAKLRL
jgi:hypothetical protein